MRIALEGSSPNRGQSVLLFWALSALIAYLRDVLDWPIGAEAFDELPFEYESKELVIDTQTATRIEEIKQLHSLAAGPRVGRLSNTTHPCCAVSAPTGGR